MKRICQRLAVAALAAVLGVPALAQHGGGAPYAPFAHGGTGKPGAKDPKVEKDRTAALKLEKQLKAKPKDAALRNKVADAYYLLGHDMMMSPILDRKVKYRGALANFRIALKYNPKQSQAAGEKNMIEAIYRQMGRPIPQ